jgi:TFIIF-interacting CTD phosphatase-like protein
MKTVILDIDRTLVHSVNTFKVQQSWKEKFEWFGACGYITFLRPHVREFIEEITSTYNVGIFTASDNFYAENVVKELFKKPPMFIFSSREYDDSFDMYGREKPLEYVTYKFPNIDDCIIIDDSSLIKKSNGDRCYKIKPFCVCYDNVPAFNPLSEGDVELLECLEWLKRDN